MSEPSDLEPAHDSKIVATLRAQFACAGHELHVLHNRDGRVLYEVRRWGQARIFSTVHDVTAFLVQVGGRA